MQQNNKVHLFTILLKLWAARGTAASKTGKFGNLELRPSRRRQYQELLSATLDEHLSQRCFLGDASIKISLWRSHRRVGGWYTAVNRAGAIS